MTLIRSTQSAKEILGVDLFKYIMAMAVIAIHVSLPSCCGEPFPLICRWFNSLAVPFFFTVSGYFLARKISVIESPECKADIIRQRSFAIFRLFALWTLIYFPLAMAVYIFDGTPLLKIVTSTIISIFSRGEMVCAWPLWFLYSMALMTFAISFVIRHSKYRFVFAMLVALFYIGYVLIRSYDTSTLPRPVMFICSILPFRAIGGGAYFLAGFVMFKYIDKLNKAIYAIGMLIISLILFYTGLPCTEIIGGCAVFIIANLLPMGNKALCLNMRMQSMWIYYLHMYVIFIATVIARYSEIQLLLWPTFFMVSVVAMAIAGYVTKLSNKSRFGWLLTLIK